MILSTENSDVRRTISYFRSRAQQASLNPHRPHSYLLGQNTGGLKKMKVKSTGALMSAGALTLTVMASHSLAMARRSDKNTSDDTSTTNSGSTYGGTSTTPAPTATPNSSYPSGSYGTGTGTTGTGSDNTTGTGTGTTGTG